MTSLKPSRVERSTVPAERSGDAEVLLREPRVRRDIHADILKNVSMASGAERGWGWRVLDGDEFFLRGESIL